MHKYLLVSLITAITCLIGSISYVSAAELDVAMPTAISSDDYDVSDYEASDYDNLTYAQQTFVDNTINNLYVKMGYVADPYFVQDIITELNKLKTTQPDLAILIDVIVEKIYNNYSSDLASIGQELKDEIAPVRKITDKQYIMSKKQFMRSFRDRAWQIINRYSQASEQQVISRQIKTKLDTLSGSLTPDELKDLKSYTDSLITPALSGADYSMILSSIESIYADSSSNNTVSPILVEGSLTGSNNLSYQLSSKAVKYSGSTMLDLWSTGIYRLNSMIYFTNMSDSAVKSIINNGTIIKVMIKITNNSDQNQSISSGSPTLKDSTGLQHGQQYYSSDASGIIKPKETVTIPYYFMIEKGATVEYVIYSGPFTYIDGTYLIENK